MNGPATKDVKALFAQAVTEDYKSYSTNEKFLTLDQIVGLFSAIGVAVPDLKWEVLDIIPVGDRIVVRGKATGTPTGDFLGQKPTGKSFDTMEIAVFTVRAGKLASAYHVENWVEALQQMAK